MKLNKIEPRFLEFIPRDLEAGVLYISERFSTASHLCACGCGEKVVTPLSPVDWQLRREGQLVSLYPSIGNWNYACQSHYWIRKNQIAWAGKLSSSQIAHVQKKDYADKVNYIASVNRQKEQEALQAANARKESPFFSNSNLWAIITKWFKDLFMI